MLDCTVGRSLATRLMIGAVCCSVFVLTPLARGEEGDDAAAATAVKRIVLFNSGVGYFEHRGTVEGDAEIELQFDVEDVNDLLKSMILEDRDGGKISTVTYDSRDPISRTLKTFSVDLTNMPTLGQLLSQIRGERVVVEALDTTIEGAIVGVEKQRQTAKLSGVVEIELLTLLTDEGLKRVPLDTVGRIELANDELDEELRKALTLLASAHDAEKKSVTLQFRGEGERRIRVGYIQQAPVWKTSYRLVLDEGDEAGEQEGQQEAADEKGEEPLLQGWAIVENTTDDDWKDVSLSLVSGRPISFVMDLYSPLYADRPTVVPELYSSLRPQVYDQDMLAERLSMQNASADGPRGTMTEKSGGEGAGRARSGRRRATDAYAMGGMGGGMAGGLGGAFEPADDDSSIEGEAVEASLQATAQAGDVGELFQYDIAEPVTLRRQSSAMLPIINDRVEGSKVSIYNQSVHAKHPLDGVRVKNSSELHLMQGPVTVFDGGVYAGDARLPDLPPGSERLISYALDLDIEVAPTSDAKPQRLVSVKIDRGVLTAAYKQTRTKSYTLKNSGDDARKVLVEHPLEPFGDDWKLVAPAEPDEKTREGYRFAVTVKPEEPAELKITEEHTFRQDIAVIEHGDDSLRVFIAAEEVSEEIKEALREVVRRRGELAELRRQREQLQGEVTTIGQEQDRIRQNMQSLDRNSDVYKRYVEKFSKQEDRIEVLRDEIKAAVESIAKAERELNEYVSGLKFP